MGRTMRSRGVSSYRARKRHGNKLSKRISKRRVKRTTKHLNKRSNRRLNKRSNRRLNRKSFKRVSKRMRNNRKSFRRRGGAPTTTEENYEITCIDWDIFEVRERGHPRYKTKYCIVVKKGSETVTVWKRYSDIESLIKVIKSNFPKATGEISRNVVASAFGNVPSGISLSADNHIFRNNRQESLNTFFKTFAKWINAYIRVLGMNLMEQDSNFDAFKKLSLVDYKLWPTTPSDDTLKGYHNTVYKFFAETSEDTPPEKNIVSSIEVLGVELDKRGTAQYTIATTLKDGSKLSSKRSWSECKEIQYSCFTQSRRREVHLEIDYGAVLSSKATYDNSHQELESRKDELNVFFYTLRKWVNRFYDYYKVNLMKNFRSNNARSHLRSLRAFLSDTTPEEEEEEEEEEETESQELPYGWETHTSERTGQKYYQISGKELSQYEKPTGPPLEGAELEAAQQREYAAQQSLGTSSSWYAGVRYDTGEVKYYKNPSLLPPGRYFLPPTLQGVDDPNDLDPEYVMRCINWKIARGSDGKEYVQYCIAVEGKDVEYFEIWRRFSLCRGLDNVLYTGIRGILNPKYNIRFESRSMSAGFRTHELNKRRQELDEYFAKVAKWFREVVISSGGAIDLMKKPNSDSRGFRDKLKVYNFFFEERDKAVYKETLASEKAELKAKQRAEKAQAKKAKAAELKKEADEMMADGDYADAAKTYATAAGLDPTDDRLPALKEEADKKAQAQQASEVTETSQSRVLGRID